MDIYISTGQGLLGNNTYAYCDNNPINRYDPTGYSGESIWQTIKEFFFDTFGAFFDVSKKIVCKSEDHLFYGYEQGLKKQNVIGDDNKPICIFRTNASEWWMIWEYQTGIKINLGDFGYSASIGVGEINSSITYKETTVHRQYGINRIGIGSSYTKDGETIYDQYYIRTIPTAVAVVVCIFFPVVIPTLPTVSYAF